MSRHYILIFQFFTHEIYSSVKPNLQIADQSCYQLVKKKNRQIIEYSNEDIKKPVVHVKSTSEGYGVINRGKPFNANIVLFIELKCW